MKKILLYFCFFFIWGCASKPEIIRELTPVPDKDIQINQKEMTHEKENVKVSVKFLDTMELRKIAEENNPYLEGDMPLLSAFKVIIENNRATKINFKLENAVLLDGQGNQFNALTYESFKNLYPSTLYQKYEYSFIFDRYYTETQYTEDYHKRKKVAKTLFKGGKIFPGVKVQGLIPFERVSERAKNITLILSDIELYESPKTNDEQDKIEKVLEFKFSFIQKIIRLKE